MQLVTHDALLAVGAAANEDQIDSLKRGTLAHVHLAHITGQATPLEPLAQHEDVARIAVEVEQLGIEVQHPQ